MTQKSPHVDGSLTPLVETDAFAALVGHVLRIRSHCKDAGAYGNLFQRLHYWPIWRRSGPLYT